MGYRTLEMNLISATGLKRVNFNNKMEAYVVVSIAGGYPRDNQKTNVDSDGDDNPTWNFPMKFTVDESAIQQDQLTLVFRLRCQHSLGDKDVGEVTAPVKVLLVAAGEGKPFRFVTYQVIKPSGKPMGEFNFSYKFSETIVRVTTYPATSANPQMVGPSSQPPPRPYVAAGPYTLANPQMVRPSSQPPPRPYVAAGPYTLANPQMVGPSSQPPPRPYVVAGQSTPPGGYTGYAYPQPPQYGGYRPAAAASYGHPRPPQLGHGHPPTHVNDSFSFGLGWGDVISEYLDADTGFDHDHDYAGMGFDHDHADTGFDHDHDYAGMGFNHDYTGRAFDDDYAGTAFDDDYAGTAFDHDHADTGFDHDHDYAGTGFDHDYTGRAFDDDYAGTAFDDDYAGTAFDDDYAGTAFDDDYAGTMFNDDYADWF